MLKQNLAQLYTGLYVIGSFYAIALCSFWKKANFGGIFRSCSSLANRFAEQSFLFCLCTTTSANISRRGVAEVMMVERSNGAYGVLETKPGAGDDLIASLTEAFLPRVSRGIHESPSPSTEAWRPERVPDRGRRCRLRLTCTWISHDSAARQTAAYVRPQQPGGTNFKRRRFSPSRLMWNLLCRWNEAETLNSGVHHSKAKQRSVMGASCAAMPNFCKQRLNSAKCNNL